MTREILLLHMMMTRKHLLHLSQRIFEQGENVQLLAWLAREQSAFVSIPQIISSIGDLLTNSVAINGFVSYYHRLYHFQVKLRFSNLKTYQTTVDLPVFT